MKTTLIASALIALSVAASGNVFAQRGDHGNDRNDSNNHRNDNAQQYHRDDTRGGGPRHDLRRGQRLSKEYRDNRYVVSDWRARRLSAPPRGQHWVRTGNDYALAAIATGIIAQVMLSN
jgi:Ni/Co efflux regulator RcnB